jgi:hypothetical protein
MLDHIGRTRLVPLQQIVPNESARVLIKLEYENPTGSMCPSTDVWSRLRRDSRGSSTAGRFRRVES